MKIVPLCKNGENHGGVTILLKAHILVTSLIRLQIIILSWVKTRIHSIRSGRKPKTRYIVLIYLEDKWAL